MLAIRALTAWSSVAVTRGIPLASMTLDSCLVLAWVSARGAVCGSRGGGEAHVDGPFVLSQRCCSCSIVHIVHIVHIVASFPPSRLTPHASRLTAKQVTSLTAGSVGASAGLVVGYFFGRRRNG